MVACFFFFFSGSGLWFCGKTENGAAFVAGFFVFFRREDEAGRGRMSLGM